MSKFFTPRKDRNTKHEFLLDTFSSEKKSMNLSPEVFHRDLPKAVKKNVIRQLT